MPCDQVRTYKTKLEMANMTLLVKTLESMGFRVRRQAGVIAAFNRELVKGSIIIRSEEKSITFQREEDKAILPKIKIEYTKQTVATLGREKGWEVEMPKTKAKAKQFLTF